MVTGLGFGGAEIALAALAGRLPRHGIDVEVFSLKGHGPVGARLERAGIPVHALGLTPLGALGAIPLLARALRDGRFDVVQTATYHADLVGGLAARAAGLPVAWGLHNTTLAPGATRLMTRASARTCAALSRLVPSVIVTVAHVSARAHADAGYDATRMVHVPNGVDVEAFRPDAAARASVRAELGADPGARLVGLFARSSPEKDLPTFAAAARALAAREPSARFVLAGPGLDPSHAGLVALLGDAAARASLLGARDDVARLMAAMDLVTLSSVGEALPLSIAEAMACGVPCVVTDVGDCAELVGPTGEVVPPSDPRALAAAWERLLRLDDAARARRGEAARARIVERYSLDASAARLAALYRAMTA